jgi:hypothetical protein
MAEVRNAYKILGGTSEGKRPLGIHGQIILNWTLNWIEFMKLGILGSTLLQGVTFFMVCVEHKFITD